MVIDGEPLQTRGARVDQPETMNLTAGELELGYTSMGCALYSYQFGVSETTSLDITGLATLHLAAVKVHLPIDEIVIRSGMCVRVLT